MRILIDYESSWQNSFLSGNNSEPLPKDGRVFIAASSNLNNPKKPDSFKISPITHSTVLGILSRLIGDQRKLYQARKSSNFYFASIEDKIKFEDKVTKKISSNELVYIRNMTGSYDRESYVGAINMNHWLFNSSFSTDLWRLLFLSPKDLISFICDDVDFFLDIELDPRLIIERVNEFKSVALDKLDTIELNQEQVTSVLDEFNDEANNAQLKKLFPSMKKVFCDIDYIKNDKLDVRALYCSSLYLKLLRLSKNGNEISGNIKGFSVAGLTPKDFMSSFTKGKKKVYGNPYLKKEKIKGEGEVKSLLTKSSGQLEINLDIDREKAIELKQIIENAGVSAFYFGKKGLAYVSHIAI